MSLPQILSQLLRVVRTVRKKIPTVRTMPPESCDRIWGKLI